MVDAEKPATLDELVERGRKPKQRSVSVQQLIASITYIVREGDKARAKAKRYLEKAERILEMPGMSDHPEYAELHERLSKQRTRLASLL